MADNEQYHLSKPAEWIDKVIAGAVIGTEPMPGLSEQFKSQFRENIGAADATAKWQPLGFFDTVEELIATITTPAPGDAYAVGVEEPFNIWVWDGVNQRWRNGGSLKGMDGKDGEDGSDANVTAENIIAALGYTPANAENVGVPDGSIGTAQLANGAVTAEKLDQNIGFATPPVLLWENLSPTSSFGQNTLAVDTSGYTHVLYEMIYSTTLPSYFYFLGKNNAITLTYFIASAEYGNNGFTSRYMTIASDGKSIDCADAYQKPNAGSTTAGTINNNYLIPSRIFGVNLYKE